MADTNIHLDLPILTVYDKLHTIYKGVVELCLRWSISIIIAVGKRDKQYSNSLGELDRRIKNFPTGHSISPFGSHKFNDGVSILFNEETNRDINALDAVVGKGGRLEAQRISSLLWQVFYLNVYLNMYLNM
jgi:hypothetical protein